MTTAAQRFVSSPYFAVVGASSAREKFGNKVLRWYQSNELNVTPINPKEKVIETLEAKTSIKELPSPTETSLSVITPPSVTLKVLEDAKSLGIKHIWVQPGAEDQKVREFAKENTEIDIILGGPCILVDGPSLLQTKGKL